MPKSDMQVFLFVFLLPLAVMIPLGLAADKPLWGVLLLVWLVLLLKRLRK